jgi:hypothetical protein
VRSPKLSNTALGQVLDGCPLHTLPVLFVREIGGIEVRRTTSLALLINLLTEGLKWRNPAVRVALSFGRDTKPLVPLTLFDMNRPCASTGFPPLHSSKG